MKKLIDADWLKRQWEEPTDWMDGDQVLHHYTWYKTMIDVAPAVDAIQVVRCKDCKWFNKPGCAISIVDESDKPKETDFCSFGERKGGE